MLIKIYFARLYPHTRADIYHPSRKNSGLFITLCFRAAGSDYFPYTEGKAYKSADVALQRKIYDGSRLMTQDVKKSFRSFNLDELAVFYKESIDETKIRDIMLSFGILPDMEINIECLCRALAIQFRAFVESKANETDDIVALEYQKLLAMQEAAEMDDYQQASVLYPGDQVCLRTKICPVYRESIYKPIQHTWEFENTGNQTWRGRKLYLSNHADIRPKTDTCYIDIPETPPHKNVKIAVSMDTRGFEGTYKCKWIMVDSKGNDCFPNSDTFTFMITTKFGFEK